MISPDTTPSHWTCNSCNPAAEARSQLVSWTCLLIFIVPQFIQFCVWPVVSHNLQFLPLAPLGLSSPTSFVPANEGKRFSALPNQNQSSALPPSGFWRIFFLLIKSFQQLVPLSLVLRKGMIQLPLYGEAYSVKNMSLGWFIQFSNSAENGGPWVAHSSQLEGSLLLMDAAASIWCRRPEDGGLGVGIWR